MLGINLMSSNTMPKSQINFLVTNISRRAKILVLVFKNYSMVIIIILFLNVLGIISLNCSPQNKEGSYQFTILVFQFLSEIMPSLEGAGEGNGLSL